MSSPSPSSNSPDELPALPGIAFRFYRGNADLPAMLAVHDACRMRDATDPHSVCYRLPNLPMAEYEKHVSRALAQGEQSEAGGTGNVLLAEAEGHVVAHARLGWWDSYEEGRGTFRVYLIRAWVMPEWRGHGIGTGLLAWAENRARTLDAGQDASGDLAANASEGEQDARHLLEKAGYRPFFLSPELAFDDLDNLPKPVTPASFIVRSLAATDYRDVAHALIEANAISPGSTRVWTPEMLSERYAAEEAEWMDFAASCDHGLSRIAWGGSAGDQVAAFYLCRSRDGCGDVANVGVRPAYRERGLSRALMFHCLHAMRERGLITVRVFTSMGVDPEAPPEGPLAMYLKFGFHRIAYHYRYRKPMGAELLYPAATA